VQDDPAADALDPMTKYVASRTLGSSRTSMTGVVIYAYERAGGVPRGSFQLPGPTVAELPRRASLAG
jgi:hypothetical protein